MSTKSSVMKVGGVEAVVIRKPIKNLHVSVMPPRGWVRVSVPEQMKDDAVRVLLATRLGWIKRQQTGFANQERQTPREYVSGESHYLFGQRYRLEVVCTEDAPCVCLAGKWKMRLQVRPETAIEKRERLFRDWYRRQLDQEIAPLVDKWQGVLGVEAMVWKIRRMKTRWGTCNSRTGNIWFNLELAKRPIRCVEYVVLHELLHLIERKHNDRYIALLEQHMPDWRNRRDELNRLILAHEEWWIASDNL